MRSELRLGVFFLGLAFFIMWQSLRLELGTFAHPGSGLFPFGTGIVLLGLSVVLISKGWNVREPKKSHERKVVIALLLLFAYCMVLERFGFVIVTFVLIGILFRVTKPRPWWALIAMSLVVTSLCYILFSVLLHVYFPRGFLGI